MKSWAIAQIRQRGDLLLAAILVVGSAATWALEPTLHTPTGAGALVLNIAGSVALIWRRRAPVLIPLLVYLIITGCFVVQPFAIPAFSQFITFLAFYTTIAAATSVAQMSRRVAACVGGETLIGFIALGNIAIALVQAAAVVGLLTAVALLARNASAEKQRLTTDVARAAATAAQREQEAVAAERMRIARDLHDAVSHSITVSILQARGGRRVLDRDPREARIAFDTIESVSEQALVEMRRMLGVLRNGPAPAKDNPDASEWAAPPTLRQLDPLLSTVPDSIAVDLDVRGDLDVLPLSVDTTAYRILQEAVTNMIRHSDARRLAITVGVGPDALTLEVQDDGLPRHTFGPAGFGIIGMRERAAAFGGTLTAEMIPRSGFLVTAHLPLREPA